MDLIKTCVLDFDRSIFFFFQRLQRPWLDPVLAWPTGLGDWRILLPVLALGVLLLDKKKNPGSLAAVLVSVLSAEWANTWLKSLILRPRPYVYWEQVRVIFPVYPNTAFPSGHTAVIVAAAVALAHCYPKKAPWFYVAAVLVAVTRLYVGVHYPTDLFGGALVGAFCAILACRLSARWGWVR